LHMQQQLQMDTASCQCCASQECAARTQDACHAKLHLQDAAASGISTHENTSHWYATGNQHSVVISTKGVRSPPLVSLRGAQASYPQ
jgi:hypothetical protein